VAVDVQIAVIWAVQNGYVDDVAVERIKTFQADWTDFLTTRKPELLQRIGKEKAIGDELKAALKAAADQFKDSWKK
jgi:F-type H+-transporting ATPase subunit alpha